MPGPPPKSPGLRARRNRKATRAKLSATASGVKPPALPIRGCPCGGARLEPGRKKRRSGRPRAKTTTCNANPSCEGTGVIPWNVMTIAWWRRLWASQMAPEYVESDVDTLYRAASLVDSYWWAGGVDPKVHAEIRQTLKDFGDTPLNRRRLDWELEKPEEEQQGPPDQTPQKAPPDPRSTMRLVG